MNIIVSFIYCNNKEVGNWNCYDLTMSFSMKRTNNDNMTKNVLWYGTAKSVARDIDMEHKSSMEK